MWKKKIRADLDSGKLAKMPTKRDLARARDELLHEAEEVQQRREQREEDEQERARLRNEEDRLREMAEGGDWASREREAELRAVKERAEIRLRDKRPTACDVMAQNLLLIMRGEEEEAALAGDARRASHATNPWSKDDLRMGIQRRAPQLVFLSLDLPEASEAAREARAWEHWAEAKCPRWLPWWRDVAVLAADSERRAAAAADGGRVGLGGIPSRIESSVLALFEGKSLQELAEVRREVLAKLAAGRAAAAHAVDAMASGQAPAAQPIDVGYWESVQAALDVWTAQTRAQAEHEAQVAARGKQVEAKRARFAARRAAEGGLPSDEDSGMESSPEEEADPEDGAADWHGMSVARLAAAGAGAGEAPLPATAEVGAGRTVGMSAWAAKYKPRKPRYLNRVKTGWNWNHYNKVHYDRDNPPPKVVHGYKFTIFYPDLIDPSVTPTYRLEPADTPEYAILRFSAGPPYEDVAFKIVNRPWNTQPRHGFKCQFERGVLHLWFNFMLDRYRR